MEVPDFCLRYNILGQGQAQSMFNLSWIRHDYISSFPRKGCKAGFDKHYQHSYEQLSEATHTCNVYHLMMNPCFMNRTSCKETLKYGRTGPSLRLDWAGMKWNWSSAWLRSATNHHPMNFWSLFPFKVGYSLAASADKRSCYFFCLCRVWWCSLFS